MSRTEAGVARLVLAALVGCLLGATPARADTPPSALIEQQGSSQPLSYTGRCSTDPSSAAACPPAPSAPLPYVEVDAGMATLRFTQPVLTVKATSATGAQLTATREEDPTTVTVDGFPAPSGKELFVSAAFARPQGGTVTYEYGARLGQQLVVALVDYTGNPCTDPAARAVYRVTSQQTSLPIEGARVLDQTSGADGLVRVGAYATVQATRRGDLPSGTIATPALPCPYTGPFPQQGPPPVQPTDPPSATTAPATAPQSVATRVTLRPAGTLRLGRLRFTATSTALGRFRVTAHIGKATVQRSITFRGAGTVTFSLRPTAKQAASLRREVRLHSMRFDVRLSGHGQTATAAGRLRR